jgi:MFS family permease
VLRNLLETGDWRHAYIAIGSICAATMLPLALILIKRAPSEEEQERVAVAAGRPPRRVEGEVPKGPVQGILVLAGIACCVAMSMPQVHIVAYCVELDYGVARGAEMLSLMLATGIISRLASGFIADRIGGVRTVILGSVLQTIALALYIPFDGLMSLYIVSAVFGLSQGGIVPSYAVVVREYFPAREAGTRVSLVIMATILGMALGGWLSGLIFDVTGSYQAAFVHGVAWNLLNIALMLSLLWWVGRPRRAQGEAAAA